MLFGKMALVAVLVMSLADDCQRRGGDGARVPEKRPPQFEKVEEIGSMCSVSAFAVVAHNPHQSQRTQTDMVGKAWLTCTETIASAVFEVKIQRQIDAGQWVDHTAVPARCVYPALSGGDKRTCQAAAPCPKNYPDKKFRTAARAEGIHEGKAAGMTQWKTSGEVLVPCK